MIAWPTYSREQQKRLSALAGEAGLGRMTEAEFLRRKAKILAENKPPTRKITDPVWRKR